MIEDLQIFEMKGFDIEEVLKIEKVSFPSPWSRFSFQKELENKHSKIFLAKALVDRASKVLGYICLWLVVEELHLLNLAIDPQFRHRGIASSLLSHALFLSRRKGAKIAFLEVRRSNSPAISLYKRFNFKIKGIRPGYYSDSNEDAIVMSLDL